MNYNEYAGGSDENRDPITSDDVVVDVYGTSEKERLSQALDNVIDSHPSAATDEEYIEETLQMVDLDDEELITMGRQSLESTARRMLGARKRKGLARITEAQPNPQAVFEFAKIPLHEHAIIALNDEQSIPLNLAKKEDIAESHIYYTARTKVKIEELENGERQRSSSVSYLKEKMDESKTLQDYDTGEGVAEI